MAQSKPDYNIFGDLVKHELRSNQADQFSSDYKNTFCYQLFTILNLSIESVNLCKDFVNFFTLLNTEYNDAATTSASNKYPEFLNFWLNRQFQARNISSNDKASIFQILNTNYHEFGAERKLNDKISIIDETYFNKLNLLYELYKIHNSLKSGIRESCANFIKHFKVNYTSAWKKCFTENDDQFCSALDGFQKLYENSRNSMLTVCSKEGLFFLPQLVPPQSSEKAGGGTENIGNHLILSKINNSTVGLSKITSIKYPKLYELLSLQYSFLLVYYEDEKRCYMMKILREFFLYCNEHRGIYNLLLFYKEFFREFYTKNKVEYDQIYNYCSSSTDIPPKEYCTDYLYCKKELGKHLSTIKDIEEKHFDNETEALHWLISDNASDSIILQLGKDNNILSNITPILVGTTAGGLLILFFLYKFSPFGSWLHKKILKNEETFYNFDEENNQYLCENNSELETNNSNNRKIHIYYNPA
ncbi:PIR Superfamily Protein [Plasmodium ovale curtisi]|uniref:PIR Superfamily Protein n=1 Tax=Plasmodium ovale curtisi TaxID=864141 RepID=A0A1A8WNF1_PLAOA|nr:PIR Superfamily Protein [Plasmodium ovale curtisi]SBT01021.1 PIR Superfamily Protein [Plasmodium ovale curtisi]